MKSEIVLLNKFRDIVMATEIIDNKIIKPKIPHQLPLVTFQLVFKDSKMPLLFSKMACSKKINLIDKKIPGMISATKPNTMMVKEKMDAKVNTTAFEAI